MPANHFTSSGTATEAPVQPTEPPPELELLQIFAGSWTAEGVSLPDAELPGRMSGRDTYEWLPGSFFLVNHGLLQVEGHDAVHHLWVFGYDSDTGTYPIRAFDGRGSYREYHAIVQDLTWSVSGEFERATLVFGADGQSYQANWEVSKDGKRWRPLCRMTARRVG